MPEETKDAVSQDAPEAKAPPTPEISGSSEQASSERTGTDAGSIEETLQSLTEQVKGLEQKLPDLVDARFKSSKDKNIYQMRQDIDELRTIVEASGGDFSKVESQLERGALMRRLDEMEQQIRSGGAGGTAAAQDAQSRLEQETAKFLSEKESELGIQLSDDELKSLASKKAYRTEADWYKELTTALVKKAKGESIPVAAVAQPSTTGAGKISPDELVAQYEKEKQSIGRGVNAALPLTNLKHKYRKMAREAGVEFPY
jgi:hypothetical protein